MNPTASRRSFICCTELDKGTQRTYRDGEPVHSNHLAIQPDTDSSLLPPFITLCLPFFVFSVLFPQFLLFVTSFFLANYSSVSVSSFLSFLCSFILSFSSTIRLFMVSYLFLYFLPDGCLPSNT